MSGRGQKNLRPLTAPTWRSGPESGQRPLADAQRLAEAFGFELDRVRGSHHIYRHAATGQRLNLQAGGGQPKPSDLNDRLNAHLADQRVYLVKDLGRR